MRRVSTLSRMARILRVVTRAMATTATRRTAVRMRTTSVEAGIPSKIRRMSSVNPKRRTRTLMM